MTNSSDITNLIKRTRAKEVKADERVGLNNFLGWGTGILTMAGAGIFALGSCKSCFMAEHAFPAYYRSGYSTTSAILAGLTIGVLVGGGFVAGYFFQRGELAEADLIEARKEMRDIRQQYPDRIPESWYRGED